MRWFEAVSAVTTTGLSTAGSSQALSPVLVFARAWMQWYGGLGIAALSVALLMGAHAAARRLVAPEQPENVATTARAQSQQVLRVYALLTAVGVGVLWPVADDGWVTVEHVLAAVSTGGFSPFDTSLAALPPAGVWIVTALTAAGAVPLVLYFYAMRGRPGELVRDPEVRALALALALMSLSGGGESARVLGARLGGSVPPRSRSRHFRPDHLRLRDAAAEYPGPGV